MKKRKFINWEDELKRELKDPEFRVAYEEEGEKLRVSYTIALMRQKAKLTQKEMAKRLKMTQSAVARIEQGEQNLTIETLWKIGALFGKKLRIRFVK